VGFTTALAQICEPSLFSSLESAQPRLELISGREFGLKELIDQAVRVAKRLKTFDGVLQDVFASELWSSEEGASLFLARSRNINSANSLTTLIYQHGEQGRAPRFSVCQIDLMSIRPARAVLRHVVDAHCHPTDASSISAESMERLEISVSAMSTWQGDQRYPGSSLKIAPCSGTRRL
jgi:hypothetical protein